MRDERDNRGPADEPPRPAREIKVPDNLFSLGNIISLGRISRPPRSWGIYYRAGEVLHAGSR